MLGQRVVLFIACVPISLFDTLCVVTQQYAPWFSFAPTIYYRPPGFTPNNYAPDGTLLFSSFEVRTLVVGHSIPSHLDYVCMSSHNFELPVMYL